MSINDWLRSEPLGTFALETLRKEATVHHEELTGVKDVKFTCDGCAMAGRCTLVYDSYNTNGDCLLEK